MTAAERIFGDMCADAECKVCGDPLEPDERRAIPDAWSIGRGVVCAGCATLDPAHDDGFVRCRGCDKWTFDHLGDRCTRSCGAQPVALHLDGDYQRKARAEDNDDARH